MCDTVGKLTYSPDELSSVSMERVRNLLEGPCGLGQVAHRVGINLTIRVWGHLKVFTKKKKRDEGEGGGERGDGGCGDEGGGGGYGISGGRDDGCGGGSGGGGRVAV